MNKSTMKLVASLLVGASLVGLTGCSNQNTQAQNTGIGAVGGALVGGGIGAAVGGGTGAVVGAVGGGLVGGLMGYNMDSVDRGYMYHSMYYTPTYHHHYWVNKHTHMRYYLTPTSPRYVYMGRPDCRKFTLTSYTVAGYKKVMYGIACRQVDGSWMPVR